LPFAVGSGGDPGIPTGRRRGGAQLPRPEIGTPWCPQGVEASWICHERGLYAHVSRSTTFWVFGDAETAVNASGASASRWPRRPSVMTLDKQARARRYRCYCPLFY
jgi:hypothetical protein